jgi:UDP-N-acetylmuramoylalanine--D-glutamate ligase
VFRDGKEVHDLLPLSSLRILGEHNIPNVLAACAAAYLMGIPNRAIAAAVCSFRGIEGRMQEVSKVEGVRYVNDTTATMPDASVAAMKSMVSKRGRKNVVLIAGGAKKGLHYVDWAVAVKKYTKTVVLLEGTETLTLECELKRAGYRGEVGVADSMHRAVECATALSEAGDTVLLSPACSSFGMFINEFDRGEQFEREVEKLKANGRKRKAK